MSQRYELIFEASGVVTDGPAPQPEPADVPDDEKDDDR